MHVYTPTSGFGPVCTCLQLSARLSAETKLFICRGRWLLLAVSVGHTGQEKTKSQLLPPEGKLALRQTRLLFETAEHAASRSRRRSGTYLVKYRPERRVGSRFTADLTSCAGHSLVYVTKPDYSARTSSDTVLRTRATPTIRRPTPPTRARCAPLPCYRAPLTVPARAAREAYVRRTLPQQFRTVRPRHAVHATSQQGSISRDLFGG